MEHYQRYLNLAIRFLSIRSRSEKEVRDNLLKHQASEEVIEKVISVLKQQKFLSDLEFAKSWIRSRTTYKPKSRSVVEFELRLKGVNKDTIEEAFASFEDDSEKPDDYTLAKNLLKSRRDRYTGLTKQELYQKAGAFLARRGFRWEIIKKAIDDTF